MGSSGFQKGKLSESSSPCNGPKKENHPLLLAAIHWSFASSASRKKYSGSTLWMDHIDIIWL